MIAEDLGLITREVDALREQFDLPGMRVLQFGFSDRPRTIYLPHRYVTNTVVYTGTHDNDTTLGWWQHGATERRGRGLCLSQPGAERRGVDLDSRGFGLGGRCLSFSGAGHPDAGFGSTHEYCRQAGE